MAWGLWNNSSHCYPLSSVIQWISRPSVYVPIFQTVQVKIPHGSDLCLISLSTSERPVVTDIYPNLPFISWDFLIWDDQYTCSTVGAKLMHSVVWIEGICLHSCEQPLCKEYTSFAFRACLSSSICTRSFGAYTLMYPFLVHIEPIKLHQSSVQTATSMFPFYSQLHSIKVLSSMASSTANLTLTASQWQFASY